MSNQKVATQQKNISTDIAINGILIALVFIATMFINIRLPISANGGLVHLGNIPLFIAAIVFNEKKGAVAGAFGMGLFDIMSGWVAWAPFTFVVRGVMGFLIGYIAQKKGGNSFILNTIAIIVGGIWMIFGYYVTEVILYHNLYTPLASIPGNVTQIVVAAVVVLPLVKSLKKVIH